MRFAYQEPWELQNKAVKSLDRTRARMNADFSMLWDQMAGDPFPYSSLSSINAVDTAAGKITRDSKLLVKEELPLFDQLILQDAVTNARMAQAYCAYIAGTNGNHIGIGKLLSTLFGRSAYSSLMHAIIPENFPHDLLHRKARMFRGLTTRQADPKFLLHSQDPKFAKLKETLFATLQEQVRTADEFYLSRGVLTDISSRDYHADFSPAGFGAGFSYWHGPSSLLQVDPYRMPVIIERKGSHKVFTPMASLIAVHELGHALKERLSERTMPRGLATEPEDRMAINHAAGDEGVQLSMEHRLAQEMVKSPAKFGITPLEAKMAQAFIEAYIPNKLFQLAHDVLELEEWNQIDVKNFPESLKFYSRVELAKRTGIRRFVRDPYAFDDSQLDSVLYQASYFYGDRQVRDLTRKMVKKGADDSLVISGLMTGFWSDPHAQERFLLELFLPKYM